MSEIREFVEEIIADGIITPEEHESFMALVHADGVIDADESAELTRIFRLIKEGKVKIVERSQSNPDREKFEQQKAQAVAEDEAREQQLQQRLNEIPSAEAVEERRSQILSVVRKIQDERKSAKNSIAEFLERSQTDEAEAARGTASANPLLQRAKAKMEEKK